MMARMDPRATDADRIAALRALLPATGAGIWLDAATASPGLAETARALEEADAHELRVGRGGPDHEADAAFRREEAAGVVAAVIGGFPDAVVTGSGVRGLLAAIVPVLGACGAPVLAVPGLDPGLADVVAALGGEPLPPSGDAGGPSGDAGGRTGAGAGTAAIPEGAIVVAPAVRHDTGERLDLAAMAAAVRAASGRLVLDATLLAGALPFDAGTPGADAVLLAGDRWLLGPAGTAAAWLAPSVGRAATARIRSAVDPLPRRAALGLGRSTGWLLMYAGLPWVHGRTAAAAARLHGALAAIDGVSLLVPVDRLATLIPFRIAGWPADEAADELGARVFAITGRDLEAGTVRASVGAWTTDAEIDRFAGAVALLAGHTPATLPRRPALVVFPEPADDRS